MIVLSKRRNAESEDIRGFVTLSIFSLGSIFICPCEYEDTAKNRTAATAHLLISILQPTVISRRLADSDDEHIRTAS